MTFRSTSNGTITASGSTTKAFPKSDEPVSEFGHLHNDEVINGPVVFSGGVVTLSACQVVGGSTTPPSGTFSPRKESHGSIKCPEGARSNLYLRVPGDHSIL